MYSVIKVNGFQRVDGNRKVFLSGFAVVDETGEVVHKGNLYDCYDRKYVAQFQADYLNKKSQEV